MWAGYYKISLLTALSMTVTTIALAITSVFGGGPAVYPASSSKRWRDVEKMAKILADAFKILTGKAVKVLPAVVGSAVSTILSFLGKDF